MVHCVLSSGIEVWVWGSKGSGFRFQGEAEIPVESGSRKP